MNPIGVVICNYNKKDFVLQCVQSVLESIEKNFDIYVVDNASSDGSAEALKKAYGNQITVIENKENLGGSGGFNTGLRIVRDKGYSYFMCLDDDAAVDENALSVLYHYMEEHTDTGMAGCRVYHTQMPDYIQQSGLLIDFDNCTAKTIGADMLEDGSLPDVIECDTVATCAVMVRADAVKQNGVGIMPEDNFIYWDDMEWGYRFRQAGWKVAAYGKAKVWHKAGGRNAGNTFIHYYMWRNRIHFFMNILTEEQKERFADTILTEMFRMIYSVNLKGETNIVRTLMYAFDDAAHGVRGKASEEKILNRPVVPNRVKEAMSACGSVLIMFNGNYEGLGNIIRNLRSFAKDLKIGISLGVQDDAGTEQKTLQAQYPDCKVCAEYQPEKYDRHMLMCEHIFKLPEDAKEDVYIDPWCNIIYSPEDFVYCKSFEQTKKLFLLCRKEILLSMKGK